MELRAESINWDCPAARQLDQLVRLLPRNPRLDITVFGSTPLQMLVDPSFLTQDIDVFPAEESYDFLLELVRGRGLGPEKSEFYIQVCSPFAFRSASDWRSRALEVLRQGHLLRLVHPWDVLTSKLQRLEEKDLD